MRPDNSHPMCTTSSSRRRPGGFTLIELMIAVAVVGILAAIAYPSFMDAIRKSHRSDAFAALSAVQQAQERWRSNSNAYTTALTASPSASSPGLGLSATSSKGYYTINIDAANATGYTATATAAAGTTQAGDGNCKSLSVRVDRGNIDYGSGSGSPNWSDPDRCWVR